jgi:hypothetical protein
MSSERLTLALLIAKPALIAILFICVFVPSPANKILVALDTLILWSLIVLFVIFSYRQAVKGKPVIEFRKDFNPNQSIFIRMAFAVYLGSLVLLSFIGFIGGLMMPFWRDKVYDLDVANFISACAITASFFSSVIATYFGLRRHYRQLQLRG